MMFVHALLFLLLGTSVVALPVHDQHRDPQNLLTPHPSSPPAGCSQHSQVHLVPDLQVGEGKESKPRLVPSEYYCFFIKPHLSQLQPTLMLENIKNYAGVWYRDPKDVSRISSLFSVYPQNAYHNDVIEIISAELKGFGGFVVFHTLSEKVPGKWEPQYILLTSQNRHRLVGTWFRMPSARDKYLYHDRLTVGKENDKDQLYYRVTRRHLNMRQPQENDFTYTGFVQLSVPQPPACWGRWVRVPDENTPSDWADDVIDMSAHDNKFYSLVSKPGDLIEELPFKWERMVGYWYLMPYALIPVNNRLDRLHIEIRDGMLYYRVDHNPVTRLHSMQHFRP